MDIQLDALQLFAIKAAQAEISAANARMESFLRTVGLVEKRSYDINWETGFIKDTTPVPDGFEVLGTIDPAGATVDLAEDLEPEDPEPQPLTMRRRR